MGKKASWKLKGSLIGDVSQRAVDEAATVITDVAESVLEPLQTAKRVAVKTLNKVAVAGLGLVDDACDVIDAIMNSNVVTCGCGIAGLADLLTSIPPIEGIDCVCNVLTTIQLGCNSGGSFAQPISYGLLTLADCTSMVSGGAIGAIPGFLAANPPMAFVGFLIGDALVDLVAAGAQNYVSSDGSTGWLGMLPNEQVRACCALFYRPFGDFTGTPYD